MLLMVFMVTSFGVSKKKSPTPGWYEALNRFIMLELRFYDNFFEALLQDILLRSSS